MGNFFVVIPARNAAGGAQKIFRNGIIAAREIRNQDPRTIVENEWALAASFTRQNGSGGTLVADPSTGSWLLAIGTWFHNGGYSSGSESKLLRRFLETSGSEVGKELEGFFVLIFGDARTREVVAVTDIIGSCHCFQRSSDEATVLSGSSLLLASLEDCNLDLVACQEFFCTGIIYENRTCYQEVRKLGPASVFRFAAGAKKSEERYWRAINATPDSLPDNVAVESLWEGMRRSAKRIHALYGNAVCDLTGGYDSRSLVAAFLGADVRFATAVSGAADSADVRISQGLAHMLGLQHLHSKPMKQISIEQVKECLALTDGEYDLVNYAQILGVHRKLSEKFDVSINGSFGEVARGYWWELLFPRVGARGPLDAHRLAQRRYAAHRYDNSIFPSAERLDLTDHFAEVIERTNAGLFELPNTFQMDNAYLMMRMQRWQGRIASSTNQIWPCISPFMFRSVLETMLSARAMLRWRSLMIRKMLSRFSPRMASYPLEHGFPAQPVSWNNVYRFFPLVTYFTGKVVKKMKGKFGLAREAGPASTSMDSRLLLWRDEQVREVLHPANMAVGTSLDQNALGNFLARSQQRDFAFGEQWARILSLECALQAAKRVRRLGK